MTMRDLQARLELLEAEVRLLRAQRSDVDADTFEALLAHIHDEFKGTEWTVGRVIQASADNGLLLGAIRRALGGKIVAYSFAVLLAHHCGVWGDYRLRCVKDRTRDGRVFTVTDLSPCHKTDKV